MNIHGDVVKRHTKILSGLFKFRIIFAPFNRYSYNKRAHRALGRSPEEKVKGHSGAIYKGTLMLSTKYW